MGLRRIEDLPELYTRLYSARDFAQWRTLFTDSATVIRVDSRGRHVVMTIDEAVQVYERHAANCSVHREEWTAVAIRPIGNMAVVDAQYRLVTDRDVREGTDVLTLVLENDSWKLACLAYQQTSVVPVGGVAAAHDDQARARPGPPGDYGNIADWLSQHARVMPQAVAIHLHGGEVSFGGLDLLVWRAAGLLSGNGVQAGDALALSFGSELAGMLAMLAATRIGATIHWIPQEVSRLVHGRLMAEIRPAALLCDKAVNDGGAVRQILIDPVALSRQAQPLDKSVSDPSPAVPWLVITGSGSTGVPKKIPITHAEFMAQAWTYNVALALKPGDRVASLLPMDAVVTRERYLDALIAGASLVLNGSRQTDPVAWLRHHAVSILWSTVFHAEALLDRCTAANKPDLPSLRAFVLGSSTVTESLRRRLQTRFTDRLYVYYGTNEIGLVTLCGPDGLFESPRAVGVPAPNIRLEIVTPEGQALPPGQIGLVRIRGPGMASGYVDDAQATQRAFRGGWFYPSDLGRLDIAGRLDYMGRADRMMILDGINIYPAEIEKVLAAHPAVRDVAVMPVVHEVHQHIPIAAVALHPDGAVSERDLHAYARERLGPRCPPRILIMKQLPHNGQGKLLRTELGDQIVAILNTQAPSEKP